ncbi:MAG: histidine kinase [Saprospiraceae bacterium]|nr:histidine kinase [Saprospiraceae bacterium]
MKLISVPFRPGVSINDIGFRVILIPLIGVIIGWATGLVKGDELSLTQFKLAYLFCIFISFVIWMGNWYILVFLRSYFDWFEKPLKKLLAIVLTIPAYTIPVSSLLLYAYYSVFGLEPDQKIIQITVIAILIAVAFITHVYETAYTVKEVEQEKLNKVSYEKALLVSELNALKSQLDPHFMMNSLNTLSYLIDTDKEKAGIFNQNLAEIFRYMLQSKERDLVLLSEEYSLLDKYLQLISIRFEKSIDFNNEVNDKQMDDYLLPSCSLQLLAENAIKHNIFSKNKPMKISMHIENDLLTFRNSYSKKHPEKTATGIGLENLNSRVKLLTGKTLSIVTNFEYFEVIIPLKKA